mmetsp:Transcript_117241/g.328110  ORF Transcript_117241/g.328110 Transcript_117241/m.328110 type:complete len:318 (-) Transcript_117241:722-1675(-)
MPPASRGTRCCCSGPGGRSRWGRRWTPRSTTATATGCPIAGRGTTRWACAPTRCIAATSSASGIGPWTSPAAAGAATVRRSMARPSATRSCRGRPRRSSTPCPGADLPSDVVAEGGNGSRASWNGEYFVDWISDGDRTTVSVYAQKANSSVDPGFDGELGIPQAVEEGYRGIIEKRVVDDWHGRMTWGEAARRDGAPPIEIAGVDVNDMLRGLKALPLARSMSMAAITNIPRLVRKQRERVNDGFFLTRSPAALAAAYFVHPSKAFSRRWTSSGRCSARASAAASSCGICPGSTASSASRTRRCCSRWRRGSGSTRR